ncbi:protein-disulfide reductase DsbD [Methylosoma difficile]
MPFVKLIFFCWVAYFCQPVLALENPDILPPKEAFKVSAKAISNNQVQVEWQLAKGYLVYRNSLAFESQTEYVQIVVEKLPPAKTKHDEMLGNIDHYDGNFIIDLTLLDVADNPSVQMLVKFQGCSEKGVCYPPQKELFEVVLPPKAQPKPQAKPEPAASAFSNLVKSIPGLKAISGQDELLQPEQAFQFLASVKDGNHLQLNWQIAEGYYLYREKVQLQLIDSQGVQLGAYDIPRGEPKFDESFGQVETFHNTLAFAVPLQRSQMAAQTVTLKASYQGCADRGVCYPPMSSEVKLDLPAVNALVPALDEKAKPQSEQDRIVSSLHKDSLWATLLSFFGFGLLLSMTPCIFPMIPILSGIIVGHHHRHTTARAFMLSLSYVVASAVTYTLFGVLAALFGSNLQATFQQPWIIVLFSGIFMALSLSMFGFYNLDLPNSIKTKLHNSSVRHQDGSLWGAAIMGALSSLIVGPCVAAPLAGALIYIGQTGNALLGGSALFAMGMGMGLPLLLLGASAGKLLPKAGDWLNSTKAVFGVLMLAVAVWMLSRVVAPEVTMLLYAMLLIVPAVYLNALEPLPLHSSGWKKLWKGVGLTMLAYGLLLLVGLSMGNSNPLKPLHGVVGATAKVKEQGLVFERVTSVEALDARIAEAAANGQFVMLDFYADWCVSCKEMEAYTFTDSKVKDALAGFVLLQADVTENSEADQALLAKFNLVGPPGVLFFGADQQEITHLRVIGYQDANTFIATLQQVLS